MSISTRIGNVRRNFVENSGWALAGDVATAPEVSFGAEAWAIGKVGISASVAPHFQLDISNSANPTAGQIYFEGKYVPNWKRMYRLDCHSVSISGGIGAALIPDTPIQAEISSEIWSTAWGTPILRYRANGAPPARDGRYNYVAGDPTGFLGLAMGTSIEGSVGSFAMNGGISAEYYQFGSNFIELCRNLRDGDWWSAFRRGVGMAVGGNHLQFHFGGILAGISANTAIGTQLVQFLSGEVSVSLRMMWVSRLHLMIQHPNDGDDAWRYVYTRSFQSDLSVSAPYKVNYRQNGIGRWEQAWG